MCSTFSGVVYQLVGLVPGATGTSLAPGTSWSHWACAPRGTASAEQMAKALMNKSRGRIRVFVVMPLPIYIILKLGFPGCAPHLNDHLSSYQYLKIPGSLGTRRPRAQRGDNKKRRKRR